MVDYQALGGRIKETRKRMRISQEKIAKAVRISASYYSNIENGRRIPSIDTLVAIANILNVNTDRLLMESLDICKNQDAADHAISLWRYLKEPVSSLDYEEMMPEAH